MWSQDIIVIQEDYIFPLGGGQSNIGGARNASVCRQILDLNPVIATRIFGEYWANRG